MNEILQALARLRVPVDREEYDIHAAIAEALESAGIAFTHEKKLGRGRRIDFEVNGIGIEVKKGRPDARRLAEQIGRYAESDEIQGIIVVSQIAVRLPDTVHGKPVAGLSLSRLWGVALP